MHYLKIKKIFLQTLTLRLTIKTYVVPRCKIVYQKWKWHDKSLKLFLHNIFTASNAYFQLCNEQDSATKSFKRSFKQPSNYMHVPQMILTVVHYVNNSCDFTECTSHILSTSASYGDPSQGFKPCYRFEKEKQSFIS